ncbi:hybrid sensor histidine kinase/response regulator [Iningainema tapete]|uniref:histidine kinase n=1 Tax=Iningainema tapete BLCC-T55 TaxID=2748662 RepID=A0A8J7BYK2_9CYAN|nr:hybrid sensor histidine kinase/response regulator [Iningainema tapete]MBD2775892.1 hybrid sensor histidine kinase/response regulator [Iningainema tapete BLCC-T55]
MNINPDYQTELYHHFSLEVPELLSTIEQALLNLQAQQSNLDQVRTMMRATHTIKSITATFGWETIKNIAHTLEDVFRSICQPNVVIDSEMKALFFEGYECLRDPLMAEITGSHVEPQQLEERSKLILSRLQEKFKDFLLTPESSTPSEISFENIQIIFEGSIAPELEKTAQNIVNAKPKDIITLLRNLAQKFVGYAQAIELPGFLAIAQATIAALDNHPRQARTIARLALEDFRSCHAAILCGNTLYYPSSALQQLAELKFVSVEEEEITHNELVAIDDFESNTSTDSIPIASTTHFSSSGFDPPPTNLPKIVRVNVEHLEQLNYLNAELLTNQNRQFLQDGKMRSSLRKVFSRLRQFQQILGNLQDCSNPLLLEYGVQRKNPFGSVYSPSFDTLELDSYSQFHELLHTLVEESAYLEQEIDHIEQLSRQKTHLLNKQQKLVTKSRDVLLDARMLPLGSVLNRLHPVLEQLQTSHKKLINLTIKGNEVLVDKAIAERLYEPLLHLVRNAFDHGIESAEVRQQRGKLVQGKIEIRAYYRGTKLLIDVQDDGQGLDFDAIRNKAIQCGLIAAQTANSKSESQLAELLFEPGFSTAKQISDLSGRGVGLDVVRVQLQAIQGKVAVNTEVKKGTTFTLQIPLNLSIDKLLVCQAGEKVYALSADTIDQILLPKPGQIHYSEHGRVLRLNLTSGSQLEQGELIPIYRLSSILDYSRGVGEKGSGGNTLPLLIVSSHHQLQALEVDRIIWEQELVVRPFGKLVSTPSYVYGGTILADGRLTLVINGATLLDFILNKQMQVMESQKTGLIRSIQPALPRLAEPSKIESSKPTIMIIDDSITLRQALVLTLQKAGYQSLQTRDGYEANAILKTEPKVDLIICDIEMPRMNGFEFLTHCISDDRLSQIPILILSSRTALKHRQFALKLGATAYLTKPYSEQQLLSTISQILSELGKQKNHDLSTRLREYSHEDITD